MKVFISGPIKNNASNFDQVAERLQAIGHEVVNPTRLSETNERPSLPVTIKAMLDCEAIVMLPGWTRSTNAVAEAALARNLGFRVLDWETLREINISVLPITLV